MNHMTYLGQPFGNPYIFFFSLSFFVGTFQPPPGTRLMSLLRSFLFLFFFHDRYMTQAVSSDVIRKTLPLPENFQLHAQREWFRNE